MKRFVVTVGVLLCFTVIMTGADIRALVKKVHLKSLDASQNCVGYTIIEVDKGINCNGDTVQLRKTHGYYELVTLNK